ncbi:MAG TPA: cytochrome c [Sphingomicrobium sp.]|nr:cytochrome c [Sphingomicrobium sp.]
MGACDWKTGQANSAQGNISKDSRPPATANASDVTNDATNAMVMLAVPLAKDKALLVMKTRHDGMEAMGDSSKAIHRALSGTPDLATVRTNAAKIAQLSQQASTWFPAGTGPDVGKTRAKPDIWQSSEDFGSKLRNFQRVAAAFNDTTRGNDVAAMNARFNDVGGACKACHDKYRAEEQH